MKKWLFTLWMSLSPGAWPASGAASGTTGHAAAGHGFACDMTAMTTEQRAEHAELSRQLLASIQERHELPNGYSFRLPAERWLVVAKWAELERRCCPFFEFDLRATPDRGPLWLRITGRQGAKAFMKDELGW